MLKFIGFLLIPALAMGQVATPVVVGSAQSLTRPAIDASGSIVVFGNSVLPDGSRSQGLDVYSANADGSGLKRLTQSQSSTPVFQINPTSITMQPDGKRAAYTTLGSTAPKAPAGPVEEVHVIDTATGTDKTAAVDTQGCILPLAAVCFGCVASCINEPHFSADGSKIFYTVRRNQPFVLANADGSGATKLPVYSGSVASAPQRIISGSGLLVFASGAPSGPTFAAAATDVYVMDLQSTSFRNISNGGSNANIVAANPTISSDGGTVAYERYDLTGGTTVASPQIWIAHTDGGSPFALTSDAAPSIQPSISGDGKVVAFVRAGQIAVASTSPSSSGERTITSFNASEAHDPVVSGDGTRIVFTLGPPGGGAGALYAINSDGTGLHAVFAPRSANPSGVTGINYASPSPGSIFSVYGINFAADGISSAATFPLPANLGGVSLFVNGTPVPLLSVTPWQVNAHLPMELNPATASFTMKYSDGSQNSVSGEIKSASPAIFLTDDKPIAATGSGSVVSSAPQVAAAFHSQTSLPVTSANPAAAGEVIEIYGTGLGITTPLVPAADASPSLPAVNTVEKVQVTIGEIAAQALFSGLTPGLAGVYQTNCIIPAGVHSGLQTLSWKFASNGAASVASIPIR